MRAAVMQGLHKPLTVESIADPRPAPGEVVLRVARCGICGSDLHMTEDPMFGMGAGDVLGHEFAGEVVEANAAEGLKPGDLVSVIPIRGCGRCASCRAGEPAWCAEMALQGGGYAEYATARAHQCVPLPAGLSLADGAIIEPVAVALHGVNLAGLEPGAKVLILGAGPIGLAVAFWARRAGASAVIVQDIADWQRERAMEMGATGFIVDRDDPVGAAERALGGKADVVFECVGVPGLIAQAVDQVRVKGTVLVLGLCTRPDSFIPFTALSKEVRIQTSAFFTTREYRRSLDVLEAGAAEPRALVTGTIGLDEVPERFESLRTRTHDCKVLIAPGG
ncbi:MAG: alcohol dehydrogenase catalytic domain-containing protein [Sphingomonadaceae bacterium]|nr:alcohol dehydrogenase catalytic domain-containing protein [Sphingomonadaceae bacterium]